MPDGQHVVFMFEDNNHIMIAAELLEGEFDLRFKVATENLSQIASLHHSKQPIKYIQVYENKMETRHMAQVEIMSFDPVSGIVVVGHRDRTIVEMLKHAAAVKAQRNKPE